MDLFYQYVFYFFNKNTLLILHDFKPGFQKINSELLKLFYCKCFCQLHKTKINFSDDDTQLCQLVFYKQFTAQADHVFNEDFQLRKIYQVEREPVSEHTKVNL